MFCLARATTQLAVVAAALALASPASAQTAYPSKPVRIVTPNPPGGTDTWLRIFQPRVRELLGQPLVLENRPGASGAIGALNIAKSAPDGYSFLFSSAAQIVTSQFLVKELPYDPVSDFTPVSKLLESTSHTVTVNAELPFGNLQDLIDHAKKNPRKLAYGSSGIGSIPHFTGELFKVAAGVDLLHVPFKGIAQIMPEVAAGRLHVVFASFSFVEPLLDARKVKVLAAVGANRYRRLPDVPSVRESIPSFRTIPSWFSLFGPAGLPPAVTLRVREAFFKASQIPEVRTALEQHDLTVVVGTPEELAAAVRADIELAAKAARILGLKPK